MPCFTTKTTIPFGEYRPCVFTVLIGNHIWILCSTYRYQDLPKIQLYKFDTDTFQSELVECEFPESFDKNIYAVKSDQHYIYAFLLNFNNMNLGNREIYMFKMAIATQKWEFVTLLDESLELGPIVDNQLFYIQRPRYDFWVEKVDLTSLKHVRQICRVDNTNTTLDLMKNNGEIYLKKEDYEKRFIVWRVTNKGLKELSKFCYDNIDSGKSFLIHERASVENGYVKRVRERGIIDELETSTIYLHLYDFARNKWSCKILPEFEQENMQCISNLIVKDDMVFGVFDSRDRKLRIQMYETSPKLSTICMMDLIDRRNDSTEIELIIETLSAQLRNKLRNLMNWKIAENDAKLAKQQNAEAAEESIKMENEGIVEHKLQRKLQTVFDSDFSDSSDSDITDIEVEPHESSEDENIQRDDERIIFDRNFE